MKNYKRLYDIEKIDQILKVEKSDLQINKAEERFKWLNQFYYKIIPYDRGTNEMSYYTDKSLKFLDNEEGVSEEIFKKWFPELVYEKYMHPYEMENPITQVKPEKIKRAAVELYEMKFNGTVTLSELEKIIGYIYMGVNPISRQFWNYAGLRNKCGCVPEFHAELMSDEICCKVRDNLLLKSRLVS